MFIKSLWIILSVLFAPPCHFIFLFYPVKWYPLLTLRIRSVFLELCFYMNRFQAKLYNTFNLCYHENQNFSRRKYSHLSKRYLIRRTSLILNKLCSTCCVYYMTYVWIFFIKFYLRLLRKPDFIGCHFRLTFLFNL